MNIGQGAIQLSHMSIVNSMTYDQRRRDILINYRNSTSYFAGIFVPFASYIMFTSLDNELDQFAYLAIICIVLGCFAFMCFTFLINEVKLVQESKEEYDKYFMIPEAKLTMNSHGFLMDEDASSINK